MSEDAMPFPESSPAPQPAAAAVPPEHEDRQLAQRYRAMTEDVLGAMGVTGRAYWLALLAALGMMGLGMVALGFQLWFGMGVTGLQHPMMWAFYITNFVWWVGIAHTGSLLSASLYFLRVPFRTALARCAEAMTLIAAVASAAYPVLHLGRVWRFYWLMPYPNQRDLWVTFRSPLVMDVFAVMVYLVVSAIFFWIGLVPDLALIRDRSKGWRRTLYGVLSLGWEGTGRHWKHYFAAYSVIAGMVTALVIVHSGGAWNFSLAIVPAWHTMMFPPYLMVGAVLSGLGMVVMLVLPARALLGLHAYITQEHLDRVARLILTVSLVLSFFYLLDYFLIWYGQRPVEQSDLAFKALGPFAVAFWGMLVCNSLLPLSLFSARVRRSLPALFAISLLVNVGVWLDRFVMVAGSLGRGYLPYAWSQSGYHFSLVEGGIFLGSAGWFLLCFLLFIRYLPVLPLAEMRRDYLKERREKRALAAAPAEGVA